MVLQRFGRRRGRGPRFTLMTLLVCLGLVIYFKSRWSAVRGNHGVDYEGLEAFDEEVARESLNDEDAASVPASLNRENTGSVRVEMTEDKQAALREEEPRVRKGRKDKEKLTGVSKARRNAFVVAAMKSDNTDWLDKHFDDWERWIYHVDRPRGKLTVPKNKGRESMVYLTFIIDNYDDLPDNVLFIHPTRFQWHNDDPDYDGLPVLRRFQLPYLEQEGYVNLRCAWNLGCPAEIRPIAQQGKHREAIHAGEFYKHAFLELFPGKPVPEIVGASCCAQFGATRWKIRQRPRKDYEALREWVLGTPLEDALSGRVLEYSWHMVFGKQPVHCPRAKDCYCKVFGMCELQCPSDGVCDGVYTLPPYSTLPAGWPRLGWDGELRNITRTDISYDDG